MRPADIIDAHGELLARTEGAELQRFLRQAFTMEARSITGATAAQADAAADTFVTSFGGSVRAAYAYRVTEDMCDLLEHAAASLEEDDTFDRDLAPTQAGLVRFERPLDLGSLADGTEVSADWLLWGPGRTPDGRPRIVSYWITDRRRQPIAYPEWADRVVGRWHISGWDSTPQGQTMGPPTVALPMLGQVARPVGYNGETAGSQANDVRRLHALWLLLNQTVTVLRTEDVDRATRRRAGRMKIPAQVTTIALRRSEYAGAKPEGESMVEWQHRWIVRGHWRWQACGPGRTERRRIWISPFVKGPEDAPLKVSAKLYDLRK